tara:strand:+ start:10375 stop:11511 length:1137 start_codon:yes stop_codon:yes gene_type:complete
MINLKLDLRVTNKYPKNGDYIAMLHNYENLKLIAWDRKEELYEDMTGISIGYVSSLYFDSNTPMVDIKNCMASNEMGQKLFGTDISVEADKCLVLDVFISCDDKEMHISKFSDSVIDLINTSDLYANMTFDFGEKTKNLFDEFCDFFNIERLIEELEKSVFEEVQEGEEYNEDVEIGSHTDYQKTQILEEWLKDGMPDERIEEYIGHEMTYEDIDFWLDSNPKIFLGGHGYKKIAIVSDLLFSVDKNDDILYLKPLCREFLLSCAYFGSEIQIISPSPDVCKQMLDACDLPYFDVVSDISNVNGYDLILSSTSNFLGFNQTFKTLYSIDSILLFTSIVKKDWDDIKRVLNYVYDSAFNYDSFKLNSIINILLSNEKND